MEDREKGVEMQHGKRKEREENELRKEGRECFRR